MPQHFVAHPHWDNFYILVYFFLVGIVGGGYALSTALRLWGDRRDEGAARIGFLLAFPLLLVCGILLVLDLGQPIRFWHMLFDSRTGLPNFKYWSPMSVASWTLTVFGIFATVSFVEALVLDGRIRHPLGDRLARVLGGVFGRVFMIAGALLGLYLAGYAGVELSVSNQPIWSDTWTLGGLFLASGLAAAAATLVILASRYRRDATVTTQKLSEAARYFIVLELVLLAVFFITLGSVVAPLLAPVWLLLWLIVLLGIAVPLAVFLRPAWTRQVSPVVASAVILIGVLALRAVVLFGSQSF